MCGRYVLYSTRAVLLHRARRLPGVTAVAAPQGTPPKRYNIAPTTVVPLLRIGGRRAGEAVIEPARWGLIPPHRGRYSGPTLFNARCETLQQKPSFRFAFGSQRGVLPMDGYVEWRNRQPYYVEPCHGEGLWAAGLWSHAGGGLSTTIVTTSAASSLEWLHHRSPLLLTDAEAEAWCVGEAEVAAQLLRPMSDAVRDALEVRAVDPRIGAVANDEPELLEAVALPICPGREHSDGGNRQG